MSDNDISSQRATKSLLEELNEKGYTISSDLMQSIYDIEKQVQFFDDRGPILSKISKLVQSEIDKEL